MFSLSPLLMVQGGFRVWKGGCSMQGSIGIRRRGLFCIFQTKSFDVEWFYAQMCKSYCLLL